MKQVAALAGSPARGGEARPAAAGSLESWMGSYGPELQRHLQRMLPSDADAEDLLQEVWVRALRSPPDAGPGSNVRAWLYRVATNAALDRLAVDRRRCCALDGRQPELAPEPEAAPDDLFQQLSPAGRARVRERVAALPPKQRQAVWLRWVEGRGYEAIAARLDSSPESARANVYNGIKRLRRELLDVWTKENDR